MHVRRTILCLSAAFLWAIHDPNMASGQSSELMEAYNSYNTLYDQGRYSEAEPYAKEALRLGTEEFGPSDPITATLLNSLAELYRTQGRHPSRHQHDTPTSQVQIRLMAHLVDSDVPHSDSRANWFISPCCGSVLIRKIPPR